MAAKKIDFSPLDLNHLEKSDWPTYRFDEIAQNISERVDPNNTDLEVYIGLEHIDSESLHIKRFGTPDDVNGQKMKFYKGDIIFGRRRAYQRKAGIATSDGFCSAHSLVLRANPDVIDPDLFPFFMHSDLFMNRAIDISVGSLSPTINWGTLKHQEFLIPPLEQHAQIAKLLWAMATVVKNDVISLSKSKILKESFFINSIFKDSEENDVHFGRRKSRYPVLQLGDLISQMQYGISESLSLDTGVPVLRMNNLQDGELSTQSRNVPFSAKLKCHHVK